MGSTTKSTTSGFGSCRYSSAYLYKLKGVIEFLLYSIPIRLGHSGPPTGAARFFGGDIDCCGSPVNLEERHSYKNDYSGFLV
jgi:hypothetical protein